MAITKNEQKKSNMSEENSLNMSEEMASFIHTAYNEAVSRPCINPTQVCENLYRILENKLFEKELDNNILDYFLKKLKSTISARKLTFRSTNMCTDIVFTCLLIAFWLNTEHSINLDVVLTSRRKSLESELSKLLKQSDNLKDGPMLDRFGIRPIILNPENSISLIYYLNKYLMEILCSLNRAAKKDFLAFLSKNKTIDPFSIDRVEKLLSIPFLLEEGLKTSDTKDFDSKKHPDVILPKSSDVEILEAFKDNLKDYIVTPKNSGYQSLHWVLSIDPSYEWMPGFNIEFQSRNDQMHYFAEDNEKEDEIDNNDNKEIYTNDRAGHDFYKEKSILYRNIFLIDDFSKAHIRGFKKYAPENDLDGIHDPCIFAKRRMNEISM